MPEQAKNQSMTLEDLIRDLNQYEAAGKNRRPQPLPRSPDLARWTIGEEQVRQLADLVRTHLGRELDGAFICGWLLPRLERLGAGAGRATIIQVMDAFDRVRSMPRMICPECDGYIEDWLIYRRKCEACGNKDKAAHRATMRPLVHAALGVKGRFYGEAKFLEEVGPVIADLACEAFHHPNFTMATWTRLAQWLEREHDLLTKQEFEEHLPEGDTLPEFRKKGQWLSDVPRTRVIELLRARVETAAGAVASPLNPAQPQAEDGSGQAEVEEKVDSGPRCKPQPPAPSALADRVSFDDATLTLFIDGEPHKANQVGGYTWVKLLVERGSGSVGVPVKELGERTGIKTKERRTLRNHLGERVAELIKIENHRSWLDLSSYVPICP